MARTHRTLKYESTERMKMNLLVPYMSKLIYQCDKAIGKDRVDECIWTYTVGITFRDLTEDELSKIKRIFKADKLEKDISQYGVKFTTNHKTGLMLDSGKEVTLSLEFKWDLPETCELVYYDKWNEISPEDVKIEDDKFLHRSTEVQVTCGEKQMMKALFKGGN